MIDKFDKHWNLLPKGVFTESDKKLCQAFYRYGLLDAREVMLDALRSNEPAAQNLVDKTAPGA